MAKSPHIKPGQDKQMREKGSQEQTKKSDAYPLLFLSFQPKYQAKSHDAYAEDLVQNCSGLCACHFSLRDPCLVDSLAHVSLVSSIPLTPTIFYDSLSGVFNLEGEGFKKRP